MRLPHAHVIPGGMPDNQALAHRCQVVCTHVYAHVYTHAYMYVYSHVYTHVCTHVYAHIHTRVCTHVYTHVHTHVNIHVFAQGSLAVYMLHTCLYTGELSNNTQSTCPPPCPISLCLCDTSLRRSAPSSPLYRLSSISALYRLSSISALYRCRRRYIYCAGTDVPVLKMTASPRRSF